MLRSSRKSIVTALVGMPVIALILAVSPAFAQTYPSKPMRLIVPFPPGGINDVLARVVGQRVGERLGQSIVIENRAGAGGTIGSNVVAKAPADGYTLLFGATSTVAVSPNLYSALPYDPIKDFAPIGQIASVASVLIVHPAVAAQTLPEFIALARAKPGTLNFGSAGSGASQHMGGELLKSLAKLDMVHVPYKGGGPAIADLVAGQLSMMIEPIPTALAQMRAGKVRGLAVSTAKRAPSLPDLPTFAEAGVAGYDLTIWFGLLAPAGTPPAIITRLNAELGRALRAPDLRERLAQQGADPIIDTPTQFAEHIRREIVKWGAVVRASGAKVD